MGRAADNEAIKLRAAWLNNASVGLIVGGVFLPYLQLFTADKYEVFHDWMEGRLHPSPEQWLKLVFAASLFFAASCSPSFSVGEPKKKLPSYKTENPR
jgi:hypothetical protein